FYCDGPIPGHGGKGVHAHIGLYAIRGLSIEGCSFYNYMRQEDISDGNKGIGIDVWDGSFELKQESDPVACMGMGSRNHFEGLRYGVKMGGNGVQTSYITKIMESDFKNNLTGIYLLNQYKPLMWNNNFEWDTDIVPSFETTNVLCEGLFADHTPGFEFVDNTVNYQADQFYFEGVRINESIGTQNEISKIQNNTFDVLSSPKTTFPNALATDVVANIFDGDNSDLYVSCNSYNYFLTDWLVNGPMAKQESGPALNMDPTNQFSSPCNNTPPGTPGFSYNNIRVDPFVLGGLEYAVDPGTLLPACVEGVVNFTVAGGVYADCGSDVYTPNEIHCGFQGPESPATPDDMSSVEVVTNGALSVYPNPSDGMFTLSLSKSLRLNKVEVFSLTGRKVYSKDLSESLVIHRIDLFGLNPGLYLMHMTSGEDTYQQKIVIE
ncbi:MAG: T9SS type A sorting domain-containing protein, partial [Bacteroidia bacterium]|nr:T9SS type A sorting domain-containing protein [Bacteroidia bacterium]